MFSGLWNRLTSTPATAVDAKQIASASEPGVASAASAVTAAKKTTSEPGVVSGQSAESKKASPKPLTTPVKDAVSTPAPPPDLKLETSMPPQKKSPFAPDSSLYEFKVATGDKSVDGRLQTRLHFAELAHDMWMKAIQSKFLMEMSCSFIFRSSPIQQAGIVITKPTYILTPKGLYYSKDTQRPITERDIVTDSPATVAQLLRQLKDKQTPTKEISAIAQDIITSITRHAHKSDVRASAGAAFLDRYIKHVKQLKTGEWWTRWQSDIVERVFLHYGYVAEAAVAVKELSKGDNAAFVDYLFERQLKFLEFEIVRQMLDYSEGVGVLEQKIISSRQTLGSVPKSSTPLAASKKQTVEEREAVIKSSLSVIFALIEAEKSRWQTHGHYLVLRGPILANVAVILKSVFDEVDALIKNNPGQLAMLAGEKGMNEAQLANAQQLHEKLKIELAKMADVMLRQENKYIERRLEKLAEQDEKQDDKDDVTVVLNLLRNVEENHVDLVLEFLYELHFHMQEYNEKYHEFNCNARYWVVGDRDIRRLFEQRTNIEGSNSGYQCYLDTLPGNPVEPFAEFKDLTPRGMSQFRRAFVLQVGLGETRKAMEKIVFKDSEAGRANLIVRVLIADEAVRKQVQAEIEKFLQDFFHMNRRRLARLKEMTVPVEPKDLVAAKEGPLDEAKGAMFPFLSDEKDEEGVFKKVKKFFPTEKNEAVLKIIADELNVLKNLLLNPLQETNWLALFNQLNDKNPALKQFFDRLLPPKKLADLALKDFQKPQNSNEIRLRELIREYLKEEGVRPGAVQQFSSKKGELSAEIKERPEWVALNWVYHRPDKLQSWQALCQSKFFVGRTNRALLELLFHITFLVRNPELSTQCRGLYSRCRRVHDASVRVDQYYELHSLFTKHNRLDDAIEIAQRPEACRFLDEVERAANHQADVTAELESMAAEQKAGARKVKPVRPEEETTPEVRAQQRALLARMRRAAC